MYSLCNVPPEQINNMIRNAKRVSEAIASTLEVLMTATDSRTVDERLWRLAVGVSDRTMNLEDALAELKRDAWKKHAVTSS